MRERKPVRERGGGRRVGLRKDGCDSASNMVLVGSAMQVLEEGVSAEVERYTKCAFCSCDVAVFEPRLAGEGRKTTVVMHLGSSSRASSR